MKFVSLSILQASIIQLASFSMNFFLDSKKGAVVRKAGTLTKPKKGFLGFPYFEWYKLSISEQCDCLVSIEMDIVEYKDSDYRNAKLKFSLTSGEFAGASMHGECSLPECLIPFLEQESSSDVGCYYLEGKYVPIGETSYVEVSYCKFITTGMAFEAMVAYTYTPKEYKVTGGTSTTSGAAPLGDAADS